MIDLNAIPSCVQRIELRPLAAIVCDWCLSKAEGDEWAVRHDLPVSTGICKACMAKMGVETDPEIAGLRRLSAKVEEVAQGTASSVEALQKARAAVLGTSVEEMLRRDEAVALKAVAQVTQEVEA